MLSLRICLEFCPESVHRPVHYAVCGVVEHLADYLAADASVGAALDLYDRRHGILVKEKMIYLPPISAVFFGRQRCFACY